jgi:mono/diheme cytochrome c family protein
MKTFLAFLLGLIAVPLAVFLYFKVGSPPVAVADKPLSFEKQIVKVPLHARINAEMPKSAPISATPEVLNAGAQLYEDKCEFCHGTADSPSSAGGNMYPAAPQLWKKHKSGVVGVSDDPVGETWWKVKNGIRLTGMPSYGKILTDTQIWQVSLLLSMADKPLPAEASRTVGLTH